LGLSSAQLIAPAFGVAILACFIVARALERRGAYVATASLS
jgi:hypothetical protein